MGGTVQESPLGGKEKLGLFPCFVIPKFHNFKVLLKFLHKCILLFPYTTLMIISFTFLTLLGETSIVNCILIRIYIIQTSWIVRLQIQSLLFILCSYRMEPIPVKLVPQLYIKKSPSKPHARFKVLHILKLEISLCPLWFRNHHLKISQFQHMNIPLKGYKHSYVTISKYTTCTVHNFTALSSEIWGAIQLRHGISKTDQNISSRGDFQQQQ